MSNIATIKVTFFSLNWGITIDDTIIALSEGGYFQEGIDKFFHLF